MITTVIFDLDDAVYVADNETNDFIAPNELGFLTIQVLRPGGLYRQPSPLPQAAPKVRIGRISERSTVLTGFAVRP